jgi:hypothetical protein
VVAAFVAQAEFVAFAASFTTHVPHADVCVNEVGFAHSAGHCDTHVDPAAHPHSWSKYPSNFAKAAGLFAMQLAWQAETPLESTAASMIAESLASVVCESPLVSVVASVVGGGVDGDDELLQAARATAAKARRISLNILVL